MKTSSSCNLNCLCMKLYYKITNVTINEFSNMIIMIFLSKINISLTRKEKIIVHYFLMLKCWHN